MLGDALKDLVPLWREAIIGDWQAELAGVDLLYLGPVVAGPLSSFRLTLRPDGTVADPTPPPMPTEGTPPFPSQWELTNDRVLSIVFPVAPMPEYGMPDWTRESMCYDVLSVSDCSLAISNRRFDGEHIIVLRRLDEADYNRRRANMYKHALDALQPPA